MIRAVKKIKKGEEIFISYVAIEDYSTRSERLDSLLSPKKCHCGLCQEDRSDGQNNIGQRNKILHNQTKAFMIGQISEDSDHALVKTAINSVQKHLESLIKTFGPEHKHRPELAASHQRLSYLYGIISLISRENTELSAHHMTKSLIYNGVELSGENDNIPIKSVGLFDETENVMYMLQLSGLYLSLGEQKKSRGWLKAAEWTCNVLYGGGKDLFLEIYNDVLKLTGLSL